MKKPAGFHASLAGIFFLLAACGGESSSSAPTGGNPAAGLPFGIPQNASLPPAPNVEVVDHAKLKAQLPESLPGFKRTKFDGQKVSVMGYKMSTAEARFKSDTGGTMQISISDIGGLVDTAKMGVAAWASLDVDKETENGYEKTTKYRGYKAMEKVDHKEKEASLSLILADRFVVSAKGYKMELGGVKAIVDRLDLKAISKLE